MMTINDNSDDNKLKADYVHAREQLRVYYANKE